MKKLTFVLPRFIEAEWYEPSKYRNLPHLRTRMRFDLQELTNEDIVELVQHSLRIRRQDYLKQRRKIDSVSTWLRGVFRKRAIKAKPLVKPRPMAVEPEDLTYDEAIARYNRGIEMEEEAREAGAQFDTIFGG